MKKVFLLGTGPGDRDLLTLKAVETIKSADIIFAPFNKGKNMALDTCKEWVEGKKFVALDFPMGKVTDEHYEKNAKLIEDSLSEGEIGVFLTIGDPTFYSTAINILDFFSDNVKYEIVSGIPSFVAAAGSSKLPLAFTGEEFLVVDRVPDQVNENVGTMAILKTFKMTEEDLDKIERLGFEYTYIQRASFEEEKVLKDKLEILGEKDYISLILARRKK